MDSKHGIDSSSSQQVVYVTLTMLVFALNFKVITGQTNSLPDFSRRNLLQINHESQPISQKDDGTVRVDPLNKLKKYRGGFDITNKYYWSSTVFTGIYGCAIGLLWLLGGIIYGIFLLVKIFCCKNRKKAKLKKKAHCYKQCYLKPILLATFLTILAIVGSGLVLRGNARFNSRTKTVVGIIIDTADHASETIYNTTGAMKQLDSSLKTTNTRGVPSSFLTSTSRKLDSEAANIQKQAWKNRRLIEKCLKIAYVVSTVMISLNLVAAIALSGFGVLRIRRALNMLITLCWFLTFMCWVLFGMYFFLHKFAGDTCTALENFQENPSNSTLGSILPCDELVSQESVLSDFSAVVYDIVNQVNVNISVLQKNMYLNIPRVCNPFSGPPDYQYQTDLCPENTIRIGDIPKKMEQPSSPGSNPVDYRECIEESLKFILGSHINQTLELDLGLSKQFCSFLLTGAVPLTAESYDTESEYPLYKRLASVLHESITSTESLNEDNDLKKREDWDNLVLKEGSEMIELLKTIDFELHVQEPFFTQLKDGLKTVEGRCAVGDYNGIESGALILSNKCLVLKVQDVHRYRSFSDMLQAESLAKVLPGIKTIDEGVQVYRRFYTEEKEKTNGVVAIRVAKPAAQPFLYLARILSVLSYGDIRSLLGLTDQTATIAE